MVTKQFFIVRGKKHLKKTRFIPQQKVKFLVGNVEQSVAPNSPRRKGQVHPSPRNYA